MEIFVHFLSKWFSKSLRLCFDQVHQSYGAELGLTSDDEDYIAPGSRETKTNKTSSESFLEVINLF